jgi:hypothetical protein
MERPLSRFSNGPKSPIRSWAALASFLWAAILNSFPCAGAEIPDPQKETLANMKKIYIEVKEMGPYPGESFILHEFFAGGPDDDDTNKDQHVVVLIQVVGGVEKMRIQVTYLERTKLDRTIKYAKEVKNISCLVVADRIKIQSSDYSEKEMDKLAQDILQAVLNKKKLLKDK